MRLKCKRKHMFVLPEQSAVKSEAFREGRDDERDERDGPTTGVARESESLRGNTCGCRFLFDSEK